MGDIWVVRHGATEWSPTGRHTGRTDVLLTAEGEEQARRPGAAPSARPWALVLSSAAVPGPAHRRARRPRAEIDDDLVEWDYGPAEGLTTEELSADRAVERLGRPAARRDPGAGGGAGARACSPGCPPTGDVCLVAHGHVLRILAAVYLGLEPVRRKHLVLKAGGIGILGHEHDYPALTGVEPVIRPARRPPTYP